MKIDPQFPTHWKQYLIQSSYAAITVFFITIILSNNPVVIASIGATAFIVFAMPNNVAAEPKLYLILHRKYLINSFIITRSLIELLSMAIYKIPY